MFKKHIFTLQLFLYFIFSTFSIQALEIRDLEFIWEDGKPPLYYQYSPYTPRVTGHKHGKYGGTANLKTLIVTGEDGEKRTIDAQRDFIFPDTYKYTSTKNSTVLYVTNTTGYYHCKKAASQGGEACAGYRNNHTVKANASAIWNTTAKAAFSSPNLNHYIGGDPGRGKDFTQDQIEHDGDAVRAANADTPRHLLSYSNGVKVGFAGDGYVIVSERGGNNSFYLLARDMDDNILGDIYIKRTPSGQCSDARAGEDPQGSSTSPYIASGRMQENQQEICVAVYPIQDLAPPGTTIGSIEMWAASSDPGDGKVMLVHTLEAPDVCYDYTVRQNGLTLASEGREFSNSSHGDISIALGLKSMEADYEMTQTKLRLDVPLGFKKAEYSPNHVNRYIDAKYIHDSSTPEIAFGANATAGTGGGGTIASQERYFAKFTYTPPNHSNKLQFNFDLNITVDTSDAQNNPLVYLLTTDKSKYSAENTTYRELKRCPISEVYQPQWGTFNIERTDSGNFNTGTQANQRFPLYTQIAGKDFDFSVVAYDENSSFTQEIEITGTTIEVELIDISSYTDADAFFRCSDPNHDIVSDIGTDSSIFITFNGTSRKDVAVGDDLKASKALRNAAFRMWLLVDQNNTLVKHTCEKDDDTCFTKVYEDFLVSSDTAGNCSSCSTYEGGCYQCLKDHFAVPFCSRDNFSIRPASYRIQLSDTNESDDPKDPTLSIGNNQDDTVIGSLSAGYNYKIDANATLYGSDAYASGYTAYFKKGYLADDLVSHLSYQTSSGSNCADTSNKDLETRFFDGRISGNIDDPSNRTSNNLQSNSNVGDYSYHIEDLIWTKVDQNRFKTKEGKDLKTFPGVDDCAGIHNDIPKRGKVELYAIATDKTSKNGCGISSTLSAVSPGDKKYTDLNIRFKPYNFDVSSIKMKLPNDKNFVYMNPEMNKIPSENMSVQFDGNITAQGKGNIQLSNYTTGCAAHDVAFDINYTSQRFGVPITLEDIKTIGTVPHKVPLRRNYKDIADTLQTSDLNETGLKVPITALSTQFEDDKNGSARVKLYYNFIPPAGKPVDNAINPIQMTFDTSDAHSADASSSTHLGNNFIPKGAAPLAKQSIDFLYARVTPGEASYIIPRTQNTTTINLYVEAYCDDINTTACAFHNIPTASLISPDGWRVSENHSNPSDGQVNTLSDNGNTLTISPNTDIDISPNPKQIQLTLPSSTPRPYNTILKMTTPPWLFPEPIKTKWLGGGGWAGTGKTGLILDVDANQDNLNKRTEW